jgi:hypothetical protein
MDDAQVRLQGGCTVITVPGTTRPAARGRRRPCRILAGAAGHSHDTRPERG